VWKNEKGEAASLQTVRQKMAAGRWSLLCLPKERVMTKADLKKREGVK
jgi:hypothetical protein